MPPRTAPDTAEHDTGVRVRAILWGRTDADLWKALDHARKSPSRRAWQFVTEQQETLTTPTCPLNLDDPKALAAGRDYGWAYVVLRAYDADSA